VEALQEFVDNFTYLGIFAVLLLAALGAPIPEEMSIIAAAVLSNEGIVRWWLMVPICLFCVLSGDMVLYWVGRHWGQPVLNWRLVRLLLSPAREQWLKVAYRRHAVKTVVTARHIIGLRAAAFLTAGSANVPFWKFLAADAGAALFGVPLLFGLAYFFTDEIKSHHGRCAPGGALARPRWPPGANGDAGRPRVAMASSRRTGTAGRELARETFARPLSLGTATYPVPKNGRIVDPFCRRQRDRRIVHLHEESGESPEEESGESPESDRTNVR